MQYRKDLKSGNSLSALGFGCMRLPGNFGMPDYAKSEKLFLDAIDMGINYFDTAYLYPGSEAILGDFLTKNKVRERFYIATKLPQVLCKATSDFDKYLSEQLKRLKTDYIDYYLIHNISSLKQWEGLLEMGIGPWIEAKKEAGVVRQIGFSYHGPSHDFLEILETWDWDFCQIQYNYININYQAGITGLKRAAQKGLPVIIMEPLLGGRLASSLPAKAQTVFKTANPNRSYAAWALKWLWNQPEVTVILSGMNHADQVEDNISTASSTPPESLSEEEIGAIESVIKIFNDSYKIPCTGCNYCMPCPKKINIPAAFTAYNASYSINKWDGIKQYMLSCGVMSDNPHYASSCVKCGKCEQHCPQGIQIRDSLELVTGRLDSFLYKTGAKVIKKIM